MKLPLIKLFSFLTNHVNVYLIDPDECLTSSRIMLSQFLEPYKLQWNWIGFIGQTYKNTNLVNLHEECNLYIYCGHGSGDKFIENKHLSKINNCPSALLWGCSSAQLICHGVHDPVGTSLQYLLNGAKYVVGNLWDVTDRDLDKLSIDCMTITFDKLDSKGLESLPMNVQRSRNVCKLKFIVGCSPITYGC